MTFTKLGRILAVLAITLGALRIATAVLVLASDDPANAASAILGSKTTGQAIDQGLYTIVFGILVGVLTDISKSVAKLRPSPSEKSNRLAAISELEVERRPASARVECNG